MSRAVILICALLALVAACGSPPSSDPAATITLTIPDPSHLPSTTRTQQLSVGQTLAVHVQHTDSAGYWQQVDPGNTAVLAQQGPARTASDCPSGNVGCPSTVELVYRAVKAGQSTMVWHFLGLGPGLRKPGQPSAPCPGDASQECPVGIFSIDVRVA